ncbi:MAG: hypothetical protein M1830_000820, partial [Pleopsidium flavum]
MSSPAPDWVPTSSQETHSSDTSRNTADSVPGSSQETHSSGKTRNTEDWVPSSSHLSNETHAYSTATPNMATRGRPTPRPRYNENDEANKSSRVESSDSGFSAFVTLHGTSSQVTLRLYKNKSIDKLYRDVTAAFHNALDPNINVAHWREGGKIERVRVVWNSRDGNVLKDTILFDGNLLTTLTMMENRSGQGDILEVFLK